MMSVLSMADQQQSSPEVTTDLPDQLDSSGAKLVYFYVNKTEGATIEELQDALDMKKVTLYSLLQTLTDHGLIEKTENTYVCRGQAIGGSQ
jgi:predicted transcriptional regulator